MLLVLRIRGLRKQAPPGQDILSPTAYFCRTSAQQPALLRECCHEGGLDGQQGHIIAAVFRDFLFERDHRHNPWLDISVWVGRRQFGRLANGLGDNSAIPQPIIIQKGTIDFQHDCHRGSPRSSPRWPTQCPGLDNGSAERVAGIAAMQVTYGTWHSVHRKAGTGPVSTPSGLV